MNILVLFDGAGLARLGLEQAAHSCIGVELDPVAHHLSKFIGDPKQLILADVRELPEQLWLWADAVWASPPCQAISAARTQGAPVSTYSENLLDWSLGIVDRYPHLKAVWVENVLQYGKGRNEWGTAYNAAQFKGARQNRNRIIGGKYRHPLRFEREYKRVYPELDLCPCITATEYKGCASDTRRASRYYGRRLTLQECAWHMGLDSIPEGWGQAPAFFKGTPGEWVQAQYRALGNGVPVWLASAFGAEYC